MPLRAVDAYATRMRVRTPGQAIVEFCLIAMLFFTLLFAIFDFGMLLNDWISVTTGASVGARQAAVGACLGWTDGTRSGCPAGEHSIVEVVRESVPLLAVSAPTWVALIDWTNGCDATSCAAYSRPWRPPRDGARPRNPRTSTRRRRVDGGRSVSPMARPITTIPVIPTAHQVSRSMTR